MSRRKPSGVWKEFIKLTNDKSHLVQCKTCGAQIKHCNNTSNMMTHMVKVHGRTDLKKPTDKMIISNGEHAPSTSNPNDIPNLLNTNEETRDSAEQNIPTSRKRRNKTSINHIFSEISSYAPGGERDQKITDNLAYMTVVDNLPLDTPEKRGFKKFCKSYYPSYNPPSRRTITRYIDDKYITLKAKVRAELSQVKYLSLTSDTWTEKKPQSLI